MATFTVGPDGKLLMDGKPIENLYGSLGRNVTEVSTGDTGFYRSQPGAYDPQFYEQYDMGGSEGSSNVGYRLRPEVQQQLGGMIQIGQSGVGGPGEVIDPSQLQWNDRFGVVTKPANIKAPQDSMLDRAIGPIFAALVNPAIAMGSGSLFQAGGLLGGTGGLSGGASSGGLVDIPGNMSWTDIAAANPEMAAAPELFGGAGAAGAAALTPPSTPLMLAPGMENAAMIDSWLINNGLSGLAGGGLTAGLGMLGGDAITGSGLLGAGRAGLTAAGLLGSAFGGGGKPAGGGWSGGGIPGGGLDIKEATYVPNQQTQRQLDELYGGNMSGQPSYGGAYQGQQNQYGNQPQQKPWQNNLYGGGQLGMAGGYQPMGGYPPMGGYQPQGTYSMAPGPVAQQAPYMPPGFSVNTPPPTMQGQNPLAPLNASQPPWGGQSQGQTFGTKPMIGSGMGGGNQPQDDYAAYWNSLSPSTRAFMGAPGSANLAAINAAEAASNDVFARAGIRDPFGYALGNKQSY